MEVWRGLKVKQHARFNCIALKKTFEWKSLAKGWIRITQSVKVLIWTTAVLIPERKKDDGLHVPPKACPRRRLCEVLRIKKFHLYSILVPTNCWFS
jgi:hypothetical protein